MSVNIVTNAYWEASNIGKNTVEIFLSDTDVQANDLQLRDIVENYEYVVVKLPVWNSSSLKVINSRRFFFDELQYSLHLNVSDVSQVETKKFDVFLKKASLVRLATEAQLSALIKKIKPGMFATDRIALNPYFGPAVAARRYSNWIGRHFEQGRELFYIKSGEKEIGFAMLDCSDERLDYLLGGIFPDFQGGPQGVQVIAQPFKLARDKNISEIRTHVSSNNLAVISLYQYFGFSFDMNNSCYVFSRIN